MSKRLSWWKTIPAVAKDWWWLITVVLAVTGFLYTLPGRLNAVEKDVEDIKGWAKEIQGYTRAQQQMQRQAPNLPASRLQTWQDPRGDWWCCSPSVSDCDRSDAGWDRCP